LRERAQVTGASENFAAPRGATHLLWDALRRAGLTRVRTQVFLKFIYYRLKYFSSRFSRLHAFR
jgi:hypothetical protein